LVGIADSLSTAARPCACSGLGRAPAQVHVGVFHGIVVVAIADLEIDRRRRTAILELVGVAMARRKARALPRADRALARVCDQDELALDHEDELVLVAVPVPHGRDRARPERRQVDADLREPGRVAELALLARQHPRAERLGIAGDGVGDEIPRINGCGRHCFHGCALDTMAIHIGEGP
jgi:hypothetical protein